MKTFLFALAVVLSLASVGEARSQKYPSKPIRILVPFTAGSQTDLLARMIGPKMAEKWGQQVVVDNRPSAGGIVAGRCGGEGVENCGDSQGHDACVLEIRGSGREGGRQGTRRGDHLERPVEGK